MIPAHALARIAPAMAYGSYGSDGGKVRIRTVGHYVVMALAFTVLALRLWFLQVIRGDELYEMSVHNMLRERDVPAPRGIILDRHGEILVDSWPRFDVTVTPEDVVDLNATLARLEVLLKADAAELRERVRKVEKQRRPFQSVLVKENLDRKELALLVARSNDLPGVEVRPTAVRHYLHGDFLAHLLGSLGEINEDQLWERRDRGYESGDLIGRDGIELRMEDELRGADGTRWVRVDAHGRVLETEGEEAPSPGDSLRLTIDLDVQRSAEQALEASGSDGAVVALDPRTGEILAWVSQDGFDPNQFADGLDAEEWKALRDSEHHPLLNRPIQGQYAPASTFKIIMAVAGLEEGLIRPEAEVYCGGAFRFEGRPYGCWKRAGHGPMNLHDALVQSCDVYFYQLGHELGIERIAAWARRFGLGGRTGIELVSRGGKPIEKGGLVPDPAWKRRALKMPWFPGETISASIGQGYLQVTPLQAAVFIAAIANGGTLYRPQYLRSVERPEGEVLRRAEPEAIGTLGVDPRHLRLVRDALQAVVEERRGTGRRAAVEGITVAGKTGTAQVVRLRDEDDDEGETPKRFRDHAWFVAYAPAEEPEIAVAVIVEHGGHGGSAAAPIAGEVIRGYLGSRSRRALDRSLAGLDGGGAAGSEGYGEGRG